MTIRRMEPDSWPTSSPLNIRSAVLHRAGKLGLGTAVIDGFNTATAPVVGVIDADLSHPPAIIPRMFAVMQRYSADVVIGSRYIPGAARATGSFRGWRCRSSPVSLPAG